MIESQVGSVFEKRAFKRREQLVLPLRPAEHEIKHLAGASEKASIICRGSVVQVFVETVASVRETQTSRSIACYCSPPGSSSG